MQRDQPGRLTRAHQLFPPGLKQQQQQHPISLCVGAVLVPVLIQGESHPQLAPGQPVESSPHPTHPQERKSFTEHSCTLQASVPGTGLHVPHLTAHSPSSAKGMAPSYQEQTVPHGPENSAKGLLVPPLWDTH